MKADTNTIAGILAAFFLVTAILKTLLSRAERRRAENVRAAALNGGTPEAPIHLDSPFAAAPPPEQEPRPIAEVPEEKKYVWE